MAPKRRIVNVWCAIEKIASWLKGALMSVSPILRALCCLGYYALAVGLLSPQLAQATFLILFVLCLGPRTSMLKLLRAVLGAVLENLG